MQLLLTSGGQGTTESSGSGSSAAESQPVREVSAADAGGTTITVKSDGEANRTLLLQTSGGTWFFEQNTLRFSYHKRETISSFPDNWTTKIFQKETLPDAEGPISITNGKTAVVCADGDALVIIYSDDRGNPGTCPSRSRLGRSPSAPW